MTDLLVEALHGASNYANRVNGAVASGEGCEQSISGDLDHGQ
jgi:hypothetical protein